MSIADLAYGCPSSAWSISRFMGPRPGRVVTQKMRRQLRDPGARAFAESRKIEGAERADFTVAAQPRVGDELDHGAVEGLHELPPRPGISPFHQG